MLVVTGCTSGAWARDRLRSFSTRALVGPYLIGDLFSRKSRSSLACVPLIAPEWVSATLAQRPARAAALHLSYVNCSTERVCVSPSCLSALPLVDITRGSLRPNIQNSAP